MIETLAWVLPRPNKSKYIGGFPLHFEKKLLNLLGIDPTIHKVLQPFGGKAQFGIRMDINPEVHPDIIGNAEALPFASDTFDLVILDPPYSEEYAQRLYGMRNPKWGLYSKEAVRVCKEGGKVVVYHMLASPSIKNTRLVKRILLETRVWHKARIIHIYQKDTAAWN